MLTLPAFDVVRPRTLEEAAGLLGASGGDTALIAGGTDLLPNLKHGLASPKRLVSLRGIDALRRIETTPAGGLMIGAGTTLARLAEESRVLAGYPALARAAGLVAGPQLRNMGTLGGNLCLDTRCVYYNQTRFWRQALGGCLKCEGTTCFVVEGGSRCVAAFSADTPGPLIAYGATIRLLSGRGERSMPVEAFYHADGCDHTVREPDEIVTAVELPPPAAGLHGGYQKLRLRGSIDFPILSVAAAGILDEGRVRSLRIVVGALGAAPKLQDRAGALAEGRNLDQELKMEVAEAVASRCHPLSNVGVDPTWRRSVLPIHVRRALDGWAPSSVF